MIELLLDIVVSMIHSLKVPSGETVLAEKVERFESRDPLLETIVRKTAPHEEIAYHQFRQIQMTFVLMMLSRYAGLLHPIYVMRKRRVRWE
jgi:hypothetical protein